ncbi:MAG: hypothetical protein KJZ47_10900, partial [Gemmatimonadales bacterium]|nr:hypothetical protein [Gemmatimonadales bacterium]
MSLSAGVLRRTLVAALLVSVPLPAPAVAQNLSARQAVAPVTEANYRLAGRFAPYKMSKLVYSTSVTPRWIKGTEKFWYEWTTAAGKVFNIVDPVAGTKRQLFDNDRLAAELTRITRDPWDGQHLPIRAIRFVNAGTL